MKKLYLAYGSNLNKEQMSWRCPQARPVAKTWLHDYRLVFQGNPHGAHANVIPWEGYEVPVVVWEIDAADERQLDVYEGVRGGYYTKEYMQVEVAGEAREALIYIMTEHGYGLPTDGYLETIAEGYDDFNLPIQVLNEAATNAYNRELKRA